MIPKRRPKQIHQAVLLGIATLAATKVVFGQYHSDCWVRNNVPSVYGTNPSASDFQARLKTLATTPVTITSNWDHTAQTYSVPLEVIAAVCSAESGGGYQFDQDGYSGPGHDSAHPGYIIHNILECKSCYANGYNYPPPSTSASPPPGLGLMQLTSGTATSLASYFGVTWPSLVSRWDLNLQAGVRWLVQKYDDAVNPGGTNDHGISVLRRQPANVAVLENWYYAIGYYNGDVALSPYKNQSTPSPYITKVYNNIKTPVNRLTGIPAPSGPLTTPNTPFPSSFANTHGFCAKPDGTWTLDTGETGYGSVHVSSTSSQAVKVTWGASGAAVSNATTSVDNQAVGITNQYGYCYLPTFYCGNHTVAIHLGPLNFSQTVNFLCGSSSSSKSPSRVATVATSSNSNSPYNVELYSNSTCGSLIPANNFNVGDRVEVYGTGNGLRARYPDPCTDPPYAVMPDLSAGTIVGSWQCCNGYIRWKIRYDGLPGIDVWSAEGEPSNGQFFLRKKQNSTCSYALAPGRLDLDTSGAAASGFNVNTGSSCYWTAVSNLNWISITTNASGTGSAQVTFSVGVNNTPYSRTGNIVVGDQTFIITQPGNGSATSGWALNVASSNPNSGVGITVSPPDTNGLGNGTTPFPRNYNANTYVTLTAPAGVGNTTFQKWQRDGVDWSTSTATGLTMEGNHTVTAIYVPIPDRYIAVFISPQQAVDQGAKWYLAGNGPYDSGFATGPFNPGSIIQQGLSFKPLTGWVAPPQQDVVTANSGPTTIRASYTLAPTLSLSRNQFTVGSGSGGANLLVANTGGGNLNWLASTTSSWINLELSSGSATAGATNPFSFSFLANDSSLDRSGTISLSAAGAIGSPQSITVLQRGKMQVTSVQRSAHSFTLSWTADPTHTYGVCRSTDPSFANYDVIAARIPGNVATYTDTGLGGNSPYMFYKVALDDGTLVATTSPSGITQWPVANGGNDHYYQIVTVQNPISWTDARDAASAAGGYLVTVTSAAESNFMWSLATAQGATANSASVWLGGYRDPATSDPYANWRWVTGETWLYTQWLPYGDNPNVDPTKICLKEYHDYAGRDGWANSPNSQSSVPVYSYAVEYDTLP